MVTTRIHTLGNKLGGQESWVELFYSTPNILTATCQRGTVSLDMSDRLIRPIDQAPVLVLKMNFASNVFFCNFLLFCVSFTTNSQMN